MGLLPDKEFVRNKFDQECTEKLSKALISSRVRHRSLSASADKEFKELRARYANARIKEVLEWFCQNSKDKYVPRVQTAKQFRIKFLRIEEAMNRLGDSTRIILTEEALILQDQLGGLKWPGDEKKDELKFIQANIDAYKDYRSKIVALPERLRREGNNELAARVEHLSQKGTYSHNFLVWYIRDVHRYAYSWEAWNGNLMSFVFRPDRPYFDNLARAWLVEFCGTGKDWNTIKEYLK